MTSIRSFSFAALLLVLALPAAAQQTTSSLQGIYVAANAGASFDTETDPAPSFGVEFGENIHRNVQAFVAVSYFDNLINKDLDGDLSALSNALTAVTGRDWDLQGRDRGIGVIVGMKYVFGTGRVTGPYVGGGAGILNLRRQIAERLVGDVTAATLSDFGIGNVSLTTDDLTRPLFEATIGYVGSASRARFDIGYRYRRAFHMTETLDFSQLAFSVGVLF